MSSGVLYTVNESRETSDESLVYFQPSIFRLLTLFDAFCVMSEPEGPPYQPALPRRVASTVQIGVVGFLFRTFLYGLNRTESPGLDRFLDVLDSRRDETKRERGLITGKGTENIRFWQ